jgi:DNA mismatch repair protein MSH3
VMAQIGCYVAASNCTLSIFDGIYTRMGARDSLHTGQSTFLVELAETQQMLAAATPRSLLVFDELGRGTSTNDGVAIAYSTMQFVLEEVKAFTLLVTHYPQLARLTQAFPRTVGVYHMSFLSGAISNEPEEVKEGRMEEEKDESRAVSSGGDEDVSVVFMYSLVPGVAPRSFGLNVARLAHVNEEVIHRAAEIAAQMRGTKRDENEERSSQNEVDELEQGQRSPASLLGSSLTHPACELLSSPAVPLCLRSCAVCEEVDALLAEVKENDHG